ncbi:MAG: hypothetical protein ACRC0J_11325 [Shewanella oncorhynchi]
MQHTDDIDACHIKKQTKNLTPLERTALILALVEHSLRDHTPADSIVADIDFLQTDIFNDEYVKDILPGTNNFPVIFFANFVAFCIAHMDTDPGLTREVLLSVIQFRDSQKYKTLKRVLGKIEEEMYDYLMDAFDDNYQTLFDALFNLLSLTRGSTQLTTGVIVVPADSVGNTHSPPRCRSIKEWVTRAKPATQSQSHEEVPPPPFASPLKRTVCWDINEWEDASQCTPPKKADKRPDKQSGKNNDVALWRGECEEAEAQRVFHETCLKSMQFKRWFQELVRECRVRAQQACETKEAAFHYMDELQQSMAFVEKVRLIVERQPNWELDAVRVAVHKAFRVAICVLGNCLRGTVDQEPLTDISELNSEDLPVTQTTGSMVEDEGERLKSTMPCSNEGAELIIMDAEADSRWALLPAVWRLGVTLFQPRPSHQSGFKNILLVLGGTDNQFLWEDSIKEFVEFNDKVPRTGKNGLFAYTDMQTTSVNNIVCQSCSFVILTATRARPLIQLANEIWHFLVFKRFEMRVCALLVPLSTDAFHSIYRDVDVMFKEFGGQFVGSIDQELRKRLKIVDKDDADTAMHFKILCDYIDEKGITRKEELANEIDRLVDRIDVDPVVKAARQMMQTASNCKTTLVTMLWYNAERIKELPTLLKNNDGRVTFGCAKYLFDLLRHELGDDMLDPEVEWTDWDELELGELEFRATIRQPQIWKIVMDECVNAQTNLIVVLKENRQSPTNFYNMVCDTICDAFRRHRCMVFTGERVCGKTLCSNMLRDVFMGDRITMDIAGGRDFKVDHFCQSTHGVVVLEDVSVSCCKTYIDKRLRSHIDGDSFTANPKMGQVLGKQIWPPCIITTNWPADSESEDECDKRGYLDQQMDEDDSLSSSPGARFLRNMRRKAGWTQPHAGEATQAVETAPKPGKPDNDRNMAAAAFLQHRYVAMKYRTPLYKTGYYIGELDQDDFYKLVWRVGFMPVCNALYGGPQCAFSPCGGRSFGQHHVGCRFITECISAAKADIVPNRQKRWIQRKQEYVESVDRVKPRHLGRFFGLRSILDVKKALYWQHKVHKRGTDLVKPECQQIKRIIDNFCDRVLKPLYYLSHIMRGDLSVRKDCQWAIKHVMSMPEFTIFTESRRSLSERFQLDNLHAVFEEMDQAEIFGLAYPQPRLELLTDAIVDSLQTVGQWRNQFVHYIETVRMKTMMLRSQDFIADEVEFTQVSTTLLVNTLRTVLEGDLFVLKRYTGQYLLRFDRSKRRKKVPDVERPLAIAHRQFMETPIDRATFLPNSTFMFDQLSIGKNTASRDKKRDALWDFLGVLFGIYVLRIPASAQSKPELMQSADYYC